MSGTAAITEKDTDKQALIGLWVLSGVLMVLAFLLPDSLGQALTARGLLIISFTFVGSGLAYLCLIPVRQPGAASS